MLRKIIQRKQTANYFLLRYSNLQLMLYKFYRKPTVGLHSTRFLHYDKNLLLSIYKF